MSKFWFFLYEPTQTGVVLCYSSFEYAAKKRKHFLPKWDGKDEVPPSCGACLYSRADNRVLIWIDSDTPVTNTETVYTMIHECVHAAIDLMHICGLSFSEDGGSEMEAYTIEWFCRKCWHRLSSLLPKRKGKR